MSVLSVWSASSSLPAPVEDFTKRWEMSDLAEAYTSLLASGDHKGFQSLEASNVIREGRPRAISMTQMSRLSFAVMSKATRSPLGEISISPYSPVVPRWPTSLPVRSNQVSCLKGGPLELFR